MNGSQGVSLDTLKNMISMLQHRGPDEAGIYLDDHVGMGHARLSIIDLSSGTQPIHNEDQTMWIVYNGEVYNYPELREDLQKNGHHFYTTSDTEVVLHLFEEKGPDCLEQLNGQFAFAIWDSAQRKLLLARDRLGIRPLHYTIQKDMLIFSSEIKSIFMNKDISREIDPVAMDQIFTFWTTLTPRTVFKNIVELPPGRFLTLSEGQITTKRYWDMPFCPREAQMDIPPDQLSERIRDLLLDAVRIRLRSDVPVGCYLSGGLDSSAVTSFVVNNFNSDVRTFGIRFEENDFDEGDYQNQMVSFLNVNHSEMEASNSKIGATFPEVLWHCEKPLLRTAPAPLFLLSKLVHQSGYKVVLTGEGADEVFGGYNIFRESKVRRFWARYPDSQNRPELIGELYPYIFDNPRLKRTLKSFFAKDLAETHDPLYSHLIRWENTSRIKTFFSGELSEEIGSYCGYKHIKQSLPEAYIHWDNLSKAQYLEMVIFLSNYLLSSQGDRVAMAHSLEIRLPYLDPRVLELMGQVPAKWKILGLREKHILKKSFKGILPRDITTRSKHPYRAPITQSLLNEKTAEYAEEMLSEKSLRKAGLFHTDKVNRLMQKLKMSRNPSELDSMAFVGVLSSQLIHHQFVEDFSKRTNHSVDLNLVVDRRSGALKYANQKR
jgi:asparagine synthase (glutamine-hydrolysing)